MIHHGYEIDISADYVELKHDGTTSPADERIVFGILACGFSVVMFCAMLLLPGKHDRPSVWHDLHAHHWPSGDFVSAMVMVVFVGSLFGCVFAVGLRQFFPSGEELHCDCSTLIIAKIPWYNLLGQWKQQSFPLRSISELRYAVVSRGKYGDIYGIRFLANGKGQKTFAGIEAPEANKIIKGLESLGLEVIEDPNMSERIAEALRKRASFASGGV